MNLTRVLNALTDSYFALRLAGFSPDDAQRITTEAARDAVNAIPSKPYPEYKDYTHDNSDRNPLNPNGHE